jgi:hypothetical protein
MANELGLAPKLILCPADDRSPANVFPVPSGSVNSAWAVQAQFMSYWVGVGAGDTYPQSLLGGDRNLGAPNDPNYGISANSMTGTQNGADVQLSMTSIVKNSGNGGNNNSVGWSMKLHSAGNTAGAGNILLGDGSSQQVSSGSFINNWLKNAGDFGNFGPAGPASGAIARFCFP